MSSHNRNPTGKNQHGPVLKASDPQLCEALTKYHRERIHDDDILSELLSADYGIKMKPRTIKKRRHELGLLSARGTMKRIDPKDAEQIVVNAVNQDAGGLQGIRTITHGISSKQGIVLSRDFVESAMKLHFPEGFIRRQPASKKIARVPKVPVGIHERWSGDGHDKLYSIGFPIWAVVDDATGRWLGAWVVPSNRMMRIVSYLFLCLVEEYEGVPVQFTTDCGSETTMIFGFANALRDMFHPEYTFEELPAHVYLRSVHNISIERSWLRLRLQFGNTAVTRFHEGLAEVGGPYNSNDPHHYQLCQWLWPKLLRKKLAEFMEERNSFKSRKDLDKPGPSGVSRNVASSLPQKWGGQNLLLPVDVALVKEIKEYMGGDQILEFVTVEYATRIQKIYDEVGVQDLDFDNVWEVFRSILARIEE